MGYGSYVYESINSIKNKICSWVIADMFLCLWVLKFVQSESCNREFSPNTLSWESNLGTSNCFGTHREIFSKSYQIKPKSDCIYHTPIDLEQQTDTSVPLHKYISNEKNIHVQCPANKFLLHACRQTDRWT